MSNYRYNAEGQKSFHRYFTALRGMDVSSDPSEVSLSHFADLENMWCDPAGQDGVATETFPGYRQIGKLPSPIYGVYRHRAEGTDHLIVHADDRLYRFDTRLRHKRGEIDRLSPIAAGIPRQRGCGFPAGDAFYLLTGGKYYRIDRDGTVTSPEEEGAYIPLTHLNLAPYEQRNLLSDRVRNRFTALGDYRAEVGEGMLLYTVISEESKHCSVRASALAVHAGSLTVPPTVTIGDSLYTVTVLDAGAFREMMGLVSVELPETLRTIGADAFYGCTALTHINLPDSVYAIGKNAFYGCLSLEEIYLGKGLSLVGEGAFAHCMSLSSLSFGGTAEGFAAVEFEGEYPFSTLTPAYEATPAEYFSARFLYPLSDPVTEIVSVEVGETVLSHPVCGFRGGVLQYTPIVSEGLVTHLALSVSDYRLLNGLFLTVTAKVTADRFTVIGRHTPFTSMAGKDALCGCRFATAYDGRIFFTGNPLLPNTVFYSSPNETGYNDPFYIGCLCYFHDGLDTTPNTGIVSVGDALAVLKGDAGGMGGIYFHTPLDTGDDLLPRIYPAVSEASGWGATGATAHFGEETVFLTVRGLYAMEKNALGTSYELSPRSTAVNLRLCREQLDGASLAVFEGMLYLLTEGKIYLADKRRHTYHRGGSLEYEWYYLTEIGGFTNDKPLYRYTSFCPDTALLPLTVSRRADERAEGEIRSLRLEDGSMLYYEKGETGNFPVDSAEEREGGAFSPARFLCATSDALYFATEDGCLSCFNTDKRGKKLYKPSKSKLYFTSDGEYLPLDGEFSYLIDEDETEERDVYFRVGDRYEYIAKRKVYLHEGQRCLAVPLGEENDRMRIHRHFYTHAGHGYTAFCTLAMDDGGLPQYAKDTVSRSPTLRLKAPEGSCVSVYVRTDRHPFRPVDTLSVTAADAGDGDFSAFDFHSEEHASVTVREKERGWCYKQYMLVSEKPRAPFGVYGLTYSYRTAGRIHP